MKWLFSRTQAAKADTQADLDRYKALRAVSRTLNIALVKQLPKSAAPECGKKLGLVKTGTLILNNDDEIALLYDYCLYHYRRGGKTVIERYLEESPPAADSAEMTVLNAMQVARYSVFQVLEIESYQGAMVKDLIDGQALRLLDLSLAETGEAGLIVVGRLLPFTDFQMSSGTLIPLPEPTYQDKLLPVINKYGKRGEPAKLSQGQQAALVAELIRVSLHAGGADNVFYTDIEA